MTRTEPAPAVRRPFRDGFGIGGSDVLLLVAAAIAATSSYSTTSAPYNMAAIIIGSLAAAYAVIRLDLAVPRRWSVLAALVITLVPQTLRPPSPNVHQTAFYPWSVALGVAAVILLLISVLPLDGAVTLRPYLLVAALVVMGVAVGITVPGGERPQIDVWDIFQQSAAGLFHGVNPYEITDFKVPAKQTANCFNYLPVSFLAGWFGWVSFDDVRYAEVTVMLAGWLTLGVALVRRATVQADSTQPDSAQPAPSWRAGFGRTAFWRAAFSRTAFWRTGATPVALVLTAMTLAGTLRVAQQAWNESLVLGFLLIGAALLLTRWAGWAWIPVALALATKQHVALLLPLLAVWPCFGLRRTIYSVLGAIAVSAPWIVWNPSRFSTCTVKFFIDIQPRHDSISLWRFLPGPLQSASVIVAFAIALYVALRYVPRTVGGLLIASAITLLGFDLFNKQTFENQWWLFAQLLVCGVAVRSVESPVTAESTPDSTRESAST